MLTDKSQLLTPRGWVYPETINASNKVLTFKEGVYTFNNVTSSMFIPYTNIVDILHAKGLFISVGDTYTVPPMHLYQNPLAKTFSDVDKLNIYIAKLGSSLYWVNAQGEKVARGTEGGYTHIIKTKHKDKYDKVLGVLTTLGISFNAVREHEILIRYSQDYTYKDLDWFKLDEIDYNWANNFFSVWGYLEPYTSLHDTVIDKLQALGLMAGYLTSVTKYDSGAKRITFKSVPPKTNKLEHLSESFKYKYSIVTSPPHDAVVARYMGLVYLSKV